MFPEEQRLRTPQALQKQSLRLPSGPRLSKQNTEITEDNSQSSQIVIVSQDGDLVLDVSKEGTSEHVLCKVDSLRLSQNSKYFSRLLDPNGFQEGKSLLHQREQLSKSYPNPRAVPDENLPRISISDIGQTSMLKSIKPLVTDFLRIIHHSDILTAAKNPPSVNIANLAVLADRFDTVETVSAWLSSKKTWATRMDDPMRPRPSMTTNPHTGVQDEETCRQRLLTHLFLGKQSRVPTYSTNLILQGSLMWKCNPPSTNTALWWDLPSGIEEELQFRRMCILDTILSLQNFIVEIYTSRLRQCRLGYDSSPQCDSFQLGELVRFLTRVGTLRFFEGLFDAEEPDIFTGDIRTLIKDLRACPTYQVDTNHSHCGAKKLLNVGLDFIEGQLGEISVGICYECWQTPDCAHCWSKAKRLPFYNRTSYIKPGNTDPRLCSSQRVHESGRDFFMAVDRAWSSLLDRR